MSNLYRGPAKYASYQVWFIWPGGFREDFVRNQSIRNKNGLWQPCLLTDRDEMCNLYRGHSIDASYQISVHLAKWFQRRRFLKIGQSETRIACDGHACKWNKMCNLHREPFIDASYQVSVHLAKGFQRRRSKCEKLTDNRWRMPKAHFAFGKVS